MARLVDGLVRLDEDGMTLLRIFQLGGVGKGEPTSATGGQIVLARTEFSNLITLKSLGKNVIQCRWNELIAHLELDDLSGIGLYGGALGVAYRSTTILMSFYGDDNVRQRSFAVQADGNVVVQTRPQHFRRHYCVRPGNILSNH